jgi:hypothetical protein
MEYILETNWVAGADGDDPGITGRRHRVPEPQIDIEEDTSNVRFRTTDHVNIEDGGDEVHEAMDVGYQHEAVDSFVTIVIRTSERPPEEPTVERPGRVRFLGGRDATNDPENYGGLKGEIKRILDLHRTGDKEFDLVRATKWRDETGLTSKNRFRGAWDVQLDQRAAELNPPNP